MEMSSKAKTILNQVQTSQTKLGDLRKIAKDIKKDHALAMELWFSGNFFARQLAILIMDKTLLTQETIDGLVQDMEQHPKEDQNQLIDWLLANQLSKDKKTITLMESWENHPSSLLRRTFWYYQGRLRWVGQMPPPNSDYLLKNIEKNIVSEKPEVQWAMNFTAAQIGIFQKEFRSRCIAIGENTGLYKDETVARNCTPNYLPKYIAMQVAKVEK